MVTFSLLRTMAETKQDMNNGPSQSRVVLAKPRLGGFSSGNSSFAESSKSGASVLRPAQLKPSQSNPFVKVSSDKDCEPKPSDKPAAIDKDDKVEDRLKDISKENIETPIFVPLGGSSSITPRTSSNVSASNQPTSSSGFVFGQNLSERVIFQENINNGEASHDHAATNGTSELLFTNAVASVKENNQDESGSSDGGNKEGLAAAAAEYERSHARPPPPPSNYIMTGEEDEINVLQISCRLFAWESGSWRERGRGVLRLNDAAGGGAARVVARVAGSLRVVLNAQLWPAMVVERAGNKSLRITAADAQHRVKLFLIMGSPSDIAQLHRALLTRIAVLKRSASNKSNSCMSSESNRSEDQYRSDYVDKPSEPHAYDHDDSLDTVSPQDNEDAEQTQNVDEDDHCSASETIESKEESPPTESPAVKDSSDDDKDQSNSLKRKDSDVEEETSNKRQCPDIVIQ